MFSWLYDASVTQHACRKELRTHGSFWEISCSKHMVELDRVESTQTRSKGRFWQNHTILYWCEQPLPIPGTSDYCGYKEKYLGNAELHTATHQASREATKHKWWLISKQKKNIVKITCLWRLKQWLINFSYTSSSYFQKTDF